MGIEYDVAKGIPVIHIDGHDYQGLAAYLDLGKKICDAYTGADKPAGCGCSETSSATIEKIRAQLY
jgi:hypothetical protein